MTDYKEMYLKLFRATEDAMDTLVAAQRECEEMYISAPEPVRQEMSQAEQTAGIDAAAQ